MKSIRSIRYQLINIHESNSLFINLIHGDLTNEETEAIVNASNQDLILGAGVSGAIRKKGGYSIQDELDQIMNQRKNKLLENGEVEYTGKGQFSNKNLKYIFHAVGPYYINGKKNENYELKKCFNNIFKLANEKELTSISLPPISTGIFSFPKDECAKIFFDCVYEYFKKNFTDESPVKALFPKYSIYPIDTHVEIEEKKYESNKKYEEFPNINEIINNNSLGYNYYRSNNLSKEGDLHNSNKNKYPNINNFNSDPEESYTNKKYENINIKGDFKYKENINCEDNNNSLYLLNDKKSIKAITLRQVNMTIIDQETFDIFTRIFNIFICNWQKEYPFSSKE